MSDTIEVKLSNGSVVVIRNYTTNQDDYKAESVLRDGVYNENIAVDGEVRTVSKYPQINLTNFTRSYINSLVQSIDGDSTDVHKKLDALRTPDFKLVEDVVDKIVAENSPKV